MNDEQKMVTDARNRILNAIATYGCACSDGADARDSSNAMYYAVEEFLASVSAERDALAAEVARLKAEAAKPAPPARTVEELTKVFVSRLEMSSHLCDDPQLQDVAKWLAEDAIAHLSAPQVVEPLTQEELCIAVGAAKEEWGRQDLPGDGILFITRAVANAQRAKARPATQQGRN